MSYLAPILQPILQPIGLAINKGGLPPWAAILLTEEGPPLLTEESQTIQKEAASA